MDCLFIKYDFYEVLNNAFKYDNDRLANSILEDELAKLVAFRKHEVADLLRTKGIRISKRASSERILKKIKDNKKNEKVSRSVVKMIIDNNAKNKEQIINSAKDYNANGRYVPKQLPQLRMKDKDFEDKVYEHYCNFDGNNVETLINQHNINKMEIDKSNPEFKRILIRNAVLSVAATLVTVGLVYGIFYVVKKVKAANKAEAAPPTTEALQAPEMVKPGGEGSPEAQIPATELNEVNYKKTIKK